jgi:hypothetical protein
VKNIQAMGELFEVQDKKVIDHLIDAGFSKEDAQTHLEKRWNLFSKAEDIEVDPDPIDSKPPADPDAQFRKEYQDNKGVFGCTEEEYIFSRRVTEGLEDLAAI